MVQRRFILDVEADNLLRGITKIWCIVLRNIDTKEVHRFYPNAPLTGHKDFEKEFKEFIRKDDVFIGHNVVGYDFQALNKILGTEIRLDQLIDTLVLSRLFRPVTPNSELFPMFESLGLDNRVQGHSLSAWGKRLGIPKSEYSDWSKFTMEMLEYCEQDTLVTEAIYNYLMAKEASGFSKLSIKIEHEVAFLLSTQEQNGFQLDRDEAFRMLKSSGDNLERMDAEFKELFPPLKKLVRSMKVKYNKDGSVSKVSSKVLESFGALAEQDKHDKDFYHLYEMVEFNAGSNSQIGDRLLTLGWKPRKLTPKGKPATDKDTLNSAIEELSQYPQIQALSQYNIVADRHMKAQKWLDLCSEEGRVHGQINPIGTWTGRCSHFKDNMANIARVVLDKDGNPLKGLEGRYGWESRNCWTSREGNVLVGVDAAGIQLRALAHYMGDPEYTKQLIEGDIHTVNQKAAGITANNYMSARDVAKRFIYAFILGAGDEKAGLVVGVDENEYSELYDWIGGKGPINKIIWQLRQKEREVNKITVLRIIKGKKIKKQFLDRTPALKRLKEEDIPKAVEQGYLVGLDGRKLWLPNTHLAMGAYLQSFEAIIMKKAMCLYHEELTKLGIKFMQVNFVHDEFCIEVREEDSLKVLEVVKASIPRAGEILGSQCPLGSDGRIGKTWANIH